MTNISSNVRIRWVRSAAEISEQDFNECFPSPLEGLWWYLALERCGLESQFTFLYAVMEQDGQVLGIAPTFVMNVPIDLVAPPLLAKFLIKGGAIIPRLRYQRTLFVGSPCSDEGTVGLRTGVKLFDIAPALETALEKKAKELKAPMLVWKDFPANVRPIFETLPELTRLFRVKSFPGTRALLPHGDFEMYLQTLRSNARHNLKKKLKRSKAVGNLEASVVSRPSREVLDEVFSLFWQTYEHGKTKFEKLTPEFFYSIAEAECTHFVLLRNTQSGKLSAFMLCFQLGDRAINKFIGLDYSLGKDWYLYFRLWEQAVIWALSVGASEFQSGQTGYRAKLDVGHRLVALDNFCRHQNRLIHFIFSLIARTISWASFDDDLKKYLEAYPQAEEDCYASSLSESLTPHASDAIENRLTFSNQKRA